MDASADTLQAFFDRWTEPLALTQLVTLVVAVIAALVASRAAHRWQQRRARRPDAVRWRARLVIQSTATNHRMVWFLVSWFFPRSGRYGSFSWSEAFSTRPMRSRHSSR